MKQTWCLAASNADAYRQAIARLLRPSLGY